MRKERKLDEISEVVSSGNEVPEQNGAANEQEMAETTGESDSTSDVSESSKEMARLLGVIENLQSEKVSHPALEGLETNADGKVLFKGAYVSPKFVIEQYEQTQAENTSESERKSQVEAAQQELFNAVESAIVNLREESLPGLGKEHAALADEYILGQADLILTRALRAGENLSPELIEQTGREAIDKAKRLFGIFGEIQVKENRRYAETYKVQPDGRPGVPLPADEGKLSKSERHRLAKERTRLAMAMRGDG